MQFDDFQVWHRQGTYNYYILILQKINWLCSFNLNGHQVACSQVREAHGLEPLVDIIKTTEYHTNKPLIAAASGALWKCAASNKNVKVLSGVS